MVADNGTVHGSSSTTLSHLFLTTSMSLPAALVLSILPTIVLALKSSALGEHRGPPGGPRRHGEDWSSRTPSRGLDDCRLRDCSSRNAGQRPPGGARSSATAGLIASSSPASQNLDILDANLFTPALILIKFTYFRPEEAVQLECVKDRGYLGRCDNAVRSRYSVLVLKVGST